MWKLLGAVDDDWGEPLAQADFAESRVGFFGADAVLILQRDKRQDSRTFEGCVRILLRR